MDIKKAREVLLKNPEFRREYYRKDLAFEIAKMLVEARILKNLTQAKLAQLIGTKQPSIARIERGEYLPSLSILAKIAKVLNTYLIPPKFAFMHQSTSIEYRSLGAKQLKQEILTERQDRDIVSNYTINAI